jgi:hypothetical protein
MPVKHGVGRPGGFELTQDECRRGWALAFLFSCGKQEHDDRESERTLLVVQRNASRVVPKCSQVAGSAFRGASFEPDGQDSNVGWRHS